MQRVSGFVKLVVAVSLSFVHPALAAGFLLYWAIDEIEK